MRTVILPTLYTERAVEEVVWRVSVISASQHWCGFPPQSLARALESTPTGQGETSPVFQRKLEEWRGGGNIACVR